MSVRQRILALRILDKQNKHPDIVRDIGVTVTLDAKNNRKETVSYGETNKKDCTIGSLEKKLGIPAGSFRNPDGRDTRSDKLLGTLRKEEQKKSK